MRRQKLVGVFLIIMALIIMLLPVPEAAAASPASAFIVQGGKLIAYKGTDKVVTIPDTVDTIGESAFSCNTNIEKIILSDTVENIEAYSFWGCDHLKTVQIGKGMKMIGDFAFTNCTGLEAMNIPSNVRSIGIQAFSYCTGLEDISIPPEVTDICEDAFDGDFLLNIRCEPGSYADKYAQEFYERQKKMSVYTDSPFRLPEGYPGTNSGQSAGTGQDTTPFDNGIWSYLPEWGNTEIGSTKVVANQAVVLWQNAGIPVMGDQDGDSTQAAVSGDADLEEFLDMLEQTGTIPERICYRDIHLTDVTLEEGAREIGRFAFARSGVSNLTLAQGLEKIDYAAFYHCDNLAQVVLPDSVIKVEAKAFAHTPWVDNFMMCKDGTEGDFLISGGVLVAYRGRTPAVTIPEGVRVIAGEAFAGHSEIRRIMFPESLQVIDEKAFDGCNPKAIEYEGTLLEPELVEEAVRMSSLSVPASVGADSFKWTWIAAIPMMLAGSFLALRKAK